ncbi:unnamed protein product [Parnassius apollo]|uniref:(apollo) hypothetical protein n=1 Tax=Parnassius apollo TaxID=110799 RepID=A0A8S3WH32_PARAO|nr:unnamed protein product [Parnassius apollo]
MRNWFSTTDVPKPRIAPQSLQLQADERPISPTPGTSAGGGRMHHQNHQKYWPFKLPKPTSQGRQQIAAANLQHKAREAANAAPAGRTAAGNQHFTPLAVNQVDDASPDIDEVSFSGRHQYFAH